MGALQSALQNMFWDPSGLRYDTNYKMRVVRRTPSVTTRLATHRTQYIEWCSQNTTTDVFRLRYENIMIRFTILQQSTANMLMVTCCHITLLRKKLPALTLEDNRAEIG